MNLVMQDGVTAKERVGGLGLLAQKRLNALIKKHKGYVDKINLIKKNFINTQLKDWN